MRYNKSKYSTDPNLVLNLPLYETGLKENIFASYDIYAHKCSVTGATWGPQGRTFDGINDDMDCGAGATLDIVGDLTMEVWVKPTTVGIFQALFYKRDGQNGYDFVLWDGNQIYCFLVAAGVATETYTTAGDIEANKWYHLVFTKAGTVGKIYINGVDKTAGGGSGLACGSSAGILLHMGSFGWGAGWLTGLFGEGRIYNRALSLAEIQHNRNVTRWRYQ
jgi:hypothetical protein